MNILLHVLVFLFVTFMYSGLSAVTALWTKQVVNGKAWGSFMTGSLSRLLALGGLSFAFLFEQFVVSAFVGMVLGEGLGSYLVVKYHMIDSK